MTIGSPAMVFGADVGATSQAAYPTSSWTPPSSDPSGITFIPGKGLLVSDAEIEEATLTQPITHNNNLLLSDLSGNKTGQGSTVGWSNEPTGVAYVAKQGSPWNGHLFVTDDDRKELFDISSAGPDGQFGTNDDGSRTSFKTSPFGNSDPEDVAFDSTRNELWIAGGLSSIVSRVNPGADNIFATRGDNVTRNFSLPQLDPTSPASPEGVAYDPERETIYVLDGESDTIFELARNGALLNTIDLSGTGMKTPGGITLDPASTGPARTFYIADRGYDPNGARPASCAPSAPAGCQAFNDGMIREVRVPSMPAIGNRPPRADAGEDELADTLEPVTLAGFGEDGETPSSPGALTYSWTRVSGPGAFTLATPNAATTTAAFSQPGAHVMRLTVGDGALTDFDDVVVHVYAQTAPRSVNIPIRIGEDDAHEVLGGDSDGFTDSESPDNELGNTGGANSRNVMTGLRFSRMPVVKGSTITSAKIQFSVDEVGSAPASYVIRGHLSGNAPTFTHGGQSTAGAFKNISSRPPTTASVAWNDVPAWTVVRDEGAAQRTPELAPILQEIINQPTWTRGNAAVFTIQNAAGNTGRRTAEAKDGRIPPYLALTFKTPVNLAPVVDAGPSSAVTMPGRAALDGSVTDDGKPGPLTTSWTKVSGPGTVSFANAGAVDTTASFSAPGSYELRLTANDGALSSSDTMTVSVAPAATNAPAGNDRQLTASASRVLLKAGRSATVTGTVKSAGSAQAVKLQKLQGNGWVDLATAQIGATASSTVKFTVTSKTSAAVQYRLLMPATRSSNEAASNVLTVRFYRADILRVNHAREFVKVKNTSVFSLDLKGWVLKNKKNGKSVRLPSFVLKSDSSVRIHTGKGASSARHLFLGGRDMWGNTGKAVLKDPGGGSADSLRY